jgi:hypothetical protein
VVWLLFTRYRHIPEDSEMRKTEFYLEIDAKSNRGDRHSNNLLMYAVISVMAILSVQLEAQRKER